MHLPTMRVQSHFTNGDTHFHLDQVDLSKDAKFMDRYAQILGNAQARVSVSADMSLKEFGSGAGAMVTVTLSCNQDSATIESAIDLAGELARNYCAEHQKLAEQTLMKGRQLPNGNPYGGG